MRPYNIVAGAYSEIPRHDKFLLYNSVYMDHFEIRLFYVRIAVKVYKRYTRVHPHSSVMQYLCTIIYLGAI